MGIVGDEDIGLIRKTVNLVRPTPINELHGPLKEVVQGAGIAVDLPALFEDLKDVPIVRQTHLQLQFGKSRAKASLGGHLDAPDVGVARDFTGRKDIVIVEDASDGPRQFKTVEEPQVRDVEALEKDPLAVRKAETQGFRIQLILGGQKPDQGLRRCDVDLMIGSEGASGGNDGFDVGVLIHAQAGQEAFLRTQQNMGQLLVPEKGVQPPLQGGEVVSVDPSDRNPEALFGDLGQKERRGRPAGRQIQGSRGHRNDGKGLEKHAPVSRFRWKSFANFALTGGRTRVIEKTMGLMGPTEKLAAAQD